MSDPFLGEIRMFGTDFAPTGWASCNGQKIPIQQNTALFSLLGTFYGGDGKTTFALPDLQGAMPIGTSDSYFIGQVAGSPTVTLLQSEMPSHQHAICAYQEDLADVSTPGPQVVLGATQQLNLYGTTIDTTLNPGALTPVGNNQPHNNLPPYLTVNFCIATQGVFPPRG